jgi:hypothetical protein
MTESNTGRATVDKVREALAELVRLKDLIDSIPDTWQVSEIDRHETHGPRYREYVRRKPLAWAAARALLAAPAEPVAPLRVLQVAYAALCEEQAAYPDELAHVEQAIKELQPYVGKVDPMKVWAKVEAPPPDSLDSTERAGEEPQTPLQETER